MKTIKEILKENTTEATEDLNLVASEIKKIILNHFSTSYLEVEAKNSFGTPSVSIVFAIGKSNKEWQNGIILNDPAHNVILVFKEPDGGYTLRGSIVGLRIPSTDKYKYFDTLKLGWSDIKKSSPTKLVYNKLDKYFNKLKEAIKENGITATR